MYTEKPGGYAGRVVCFVSFNNVRAARCLSLQYPTKHEPENGSNQIGCAYDWESLTMVYGMGLGAGTALRQLKSRYTARTTRARSLAAISSVRLTQIAGVQTRIHPPYHTTRRKQRTSPPEQSQRTPAHTVPVLLRTHKAQSKHVGDIFRMSTGPLSRKGHWFALHSAQSHSFQLYASTATVPTFLAACYRCVPASAGCRGSAFC